MKRQILLTLAATLLTMPVIARDFTYTYEGKTLTYTVIDETAKTCEVGRNDTAGKVIIPQIASGYTVKAIGAYAFSGCYSLTSVEIPSSVTTIGDCAFIYCNSLESMKLPSSVVSIGECAFYQCMRVETIYIPSSVETIGEQAFRYCSSLKDINVSSYNYHFASVDGVLFDRKISTLLQYPNGKTGEEYTIPNSVTAIGKMAFGESLLSKVEIPNTVTSIGEQAFGYCLSLTSIIIPNSVTSIGEFAFCDCKKLSSVVLPNSITTIGRAIFSGCSLISVEIPHSVRYIESGAFNCSSLTSMTSFALVPPECNGYGIVADYQKVTLYVPDQSLDDYKSATEWSRFDNIVGFRHTVAINGLYYILTAKNNTAMVTYAEQNSLSNYEGMQSVVIPEAVEYEGESYTVTGIGEEAFNNCWGIKSVRLPSTLQSIGKLAFGYCTSLRSVVIPDEVTVIDDEAFTGCSALASVTIGSSVETIRDYAFFGCTGLSSINVPESVKNIGENAFMGVHWINEVHAESDVPSEAPVSAFSTNAYRNATLVVPDGALSTYKSHPTWSNFLAIREEGNSTTDIMVVDGAIIVRGADSVRIYNPSGVQIYSGKSGRIELPSGIYLVVTDSVSRKVRL